MIVTADSTDVSVYFRIVEDVGGTNPGEPKTGLTNANIDSVYYTRDRVAASNTDIGTISALANSASAHSDGGFIKVDDTNSPGLYRIDMPDACFATGTRQVTIQVNVAAASNAVAEPIQVDVIELDVHGTGAQKFNDAADCSILVAYSSKTNQNQFIVTARSPSSLSSNDDAYINRWIFWKTGAAAGEAKRIIDYVGSTGEIFVDSNFQGTLGTGNGVIL